MTNKKSPSFLNDTSRTASQAQKLDPNHAKDGLKVKSNVSTDNSAGRGYQLRPSINKPKEVVLIGGGIASACAAYLLSKNGIKVKLYCKDTKIAQGASSNDIGALYPLLHQQKDEISLFYQQAFWSAKKMYQELLDDGFSFSHDWCGLLEISYKDALAVRQKNFEQINAWPHELIHSIDREQASKKAGIALPHGGLFMPHAGWIAPQELVQQLFKAAEKTNNLTIETSVNVIGIKQFMHSNNSVPPEKNGTHAINSQCFQIETDKFNQEAELIVLCGGAEAIKMDYLNQLPLTSVRGQITSMKTHKAINQLSTVICHKGYLTPENNNIHCIGATFDKNTFDVETKAADDHYNLNMLERSLPNIGNWSIKDVAHSKARLRCMTPDHLPMVGPMPDIQQHINEYSHLAKDKNWKYYQQAPTIKNLYVMTGFGARGLCSAPLAAEILLADLTGNTYPMNDTQLFNLAPNRFVIRDIIKRKYISAC